ncbi:MAG: hypothetical protein M5U19_06640 [Microthrixaceae bacterium]|nr:hypothetical protein [Microthrixaceae bacterium]
MPDERWGERVTAVIVAREGTNPAVEDLRGYLDGKLAGYKMPREVVIVDEMVRSPAGKADYRWARATARGEIDS